MSPTTKKMETIKTIFVTKQMLAQQKVRYKEIPLPQFRDEHGNIPVARIRAMGPTEADEYESFISELMNLKMDPSQIGKDGGEASVIQMTDSKIPPVSKMNRFILYLCWVDESFQRVWSSPEELRDTIKDQSLIRMLAEEANKLNNTDKLEQTLGN